MKYLKTLPDPAAYVLTNYYACVEEALCIGCEACLKRCQMKAIHMENGRALIDRDRCIGCGLCVPTCEGKAIRFQAKEEKDRREPPLRLSDMHQRLAKERIKIG